MTGDHSHHRNRLRTILEAELEAITTIMSVTERPEDLGVYELIEARSALQHRLARVDEVLLSMSRSRLDEDRGQPPAVEDLR